MRTRPGHSPERMGNIASVDVMDLLTRHDADALKTAGVGCLPVVATAQSVLTTSRALKSWAFSPVTMQVPLKTAGIVYQSWPRPRA